MSISAVYDLAQITVKAMLNVILFVFYQNPFKFTSETIASMAHPSRKQTNQNV